MRFLGRMFGCYKLINEIPGYFLDSVRPELVEG